MHRIIGVMLAFLGTSAFAQIEYNGQSEKTFFTNGFYAAGFGELGAQSQKLLNEEAIIARLKFGWQLARSDYAALTLGVGAYGLDKLFKYTGAEYDEAQFYLFGPGMDIVLMPTWPAHLSLSGFAGTGKFMRQRRDEDPNTAATPIEKARLESYDVGINAHLHLAGPTWLIFSYGLQVHNFSQDQNIDVSKERTDYISVAIRGSGM